MNIEPSTAPVSFGAARQSGLLDGQVPSVALGAVGGEVSAATGGDSMELSFDALALSAAEEEATDASEASATGLRGRDGEPLSQEETTQVRELQDRDREVRAHEEAHKAAAGDLAQGGPTYEYETGPDGQDYAVGGQVQIALKPGRTPEETISNAQRARRAALAPAEPSSQDHKVAAEAAQMESEARREELESGGEEEGEAPSPAASEPSDALGLELLRRDEAYRMTAQFSVAQFSAS
jgi:hypothetical protein